MIQHIVDPEIPADVAFLTLRELADYLRVSIRTVDKLMADGVGPPCFRVGRQRRWKIHDVRSWVDGESRRLSQQQQNFDD